MSLSSCAPARFAGERESGPSARLGGGERPGLRIRGDRRRLGAKPLEQLALEPARSAGPQPPPRWEVGPRPEAIPRPRAHSEEPGSLSARQRAIGRLGDSGHGGSIRIMAILSIYFPSGLIRRGGGLSQARSGLIRLES